MKPLLLALLLATAPCLHAQQGWIDRAGKLQPDTDASKSSGGFAGLVLITSDTDWEKKWNTPAETTPQFTTATKAARGQPLSVLIFFANPRTDDGTVSVTCDIDFLKPDGTAQVHETNVACADGTLTGNPRNTRLAAPVIHFVGDPDDPAGTWTVRIVLKDNRRHVELPLKASFLLQ